MKSKYLGYRLQIEDKVFHTDFNGQGLYFYYKDHPFEKTTTIKTKKEFSIANIKLDSNKKAKIRKAALEYIEYLKNTISVWDLPYKHYSADCGCILIGNESFYAKYSNGYGDVSNKRIILIEDFEHKIVPYKIREKLRYVNNFQGKGYIYDYDIPEEAKPLFEVDGEYSVWQILYDNEEDSSALNMPTANMLIVKTSK